MVEEMIRLKMIIKRKKWNLNFMQRIDHFIRCKN